MNLPAGNVVSYSPHAIKTVANHGSEPLELMATMLLEPNASIVAYEGWPSPIRPNLQ